LLARLERQFNFPLRFRLPIEFALVIDYRQIHPEALAKITRSPKGSEENFGTYYEAANKRLHKGSATH